MAEIHRSSTLLDKPAIAGAGLGMAEIHRSSTLALRLVEPRRLAGDGRDSPLKYTSRSVVHDCTAGWGWPRFTAQVH